MTPRIASSILVGGLLRRAQAEGGFGVVLARGDPTAGSILVVLLERGVRQCLVERLLGPDSRYVWHSATRDGQDEEEFRRTIERRRRVDPDLWVVELDIASAERFAAEMNDVG